MGASVEERNSKSLTGADGNVDPKFARGLEQAEGEQIGRAHGQSLKVEERVRLAEVVKKIGNGLCGNLGR